jgi:hypothetical protein
MDKVENIAGHYGIRWFGEPDLATAVHLAVALRGLFIGHMELAAEFRNSGDEDGEAAASKMAEEFLWLDVLSGETEEG